VTANRLRALLSKLFRWAMSQDYLAANPASELPKLAKETGRERALTDDEIRAAAYHAMQAQALTTTRDVTARRMSWLGRGSTRRFQRCQTSTRVENRRLTCGASVCGESSRR